MVVFVHYLRIARDIENRFLCGTFSILPSLRADVVVFWILTIRLLVQYFLLSIQMPSVFAISGVVVGHINIRSIEGG